MCVVIVMLIGTIDGSEKCIDKKKNCLTDAQFIYLMEGDLTESGRLKLQKSEKLCKEKYDC